MTNIVQHPGGTAAQWATSSRILLAREIGVETDTGYIKVGDGVSTWAELPYANEPIASLAASNDIPLGAEPSSPSAGNMRVFAQKVGGRGLLAQKGPSGIATTLQPHLGRNYAQIIDTQAAGGLAVFGCVATVLGAAAQFIPTSVLGIATTYATAATAAAAAYVYPAGAAFYRASNATEPGGFHFTTRGAFPDASYDGTAATTGSRCFVGMTAAATTAINSADTLLLATAGFRRVHNFGVLTETNWQFHTANGTSQTKVDTGVPFVAGSEYEFSIFSPPGGADVKWQITNVTTGATAEGSATATLPNALVLMRPAIAVTTINAVARRLWLQTMYCESDR